MLLGIRCQCFALFGPIPFVVIQQNWKVILVHCERKRQRGIQCERRSAVIMRVEFHVDFVLYVREKLVPRMNGESRTASITAMHARAALYQKFNRTKKTDRKYL